MKNSQRLNYGKVSGRKYRGRFELNALWSLSSDEQQSICQKIVAMVSVVTCVCLIKRHSSAALSLSLTLSHSCVTSLYLPIDIPELKMARTLWIILIWMIIVIIDSLRFRRKKLGKIDIGTRFKSCIRWPENGCGWMPTMDERTRHGRIKAITNYASC